MWTWFPGEEIYIYTTLKTSGSDCIILHSDHDHRQHHKLVNNFNEHGDKDTILIMSNIIYSTGLNLQHSYRNVHLFSVALARDIIEQAIGRVRRVS